MKRWRTWFVGLVFLVSLPAAATPLPLWEVGMSVSMLAHPDYRGAKHYNFTPLPLPYFVYRGDRFRITREGARAQILEREYFKIDLSVAASLPNSGDTEGTPREGMPRLLPTFEVGPSFDWWITPERYGHWQLRLRVPVRAVAGFNIKHSRRVGYLTHPNLALNRNWAQGEWNHSASMGVGVLFAEHDYHNYFYGVDPEYATPERPEYHAHKGYSGARAGGFFSTGRNKWRIGGGFTVDYLGGAKFRDSPLVETELAFVGGVFFNYRFWASEERVGGEVNP
jgi:MipA family protein